MQKKNLCRKCRGTSSSKCALCTGLRFWKATTCLPAGRDARTSFGVRKPLPQTVSKPVTRPCSLPARTRTHSAQRLTNATNLNSLPPTFKQIAQPCVRNIVRHFLTR